MLEDIVGSLTHGRWLQGLERSSAKPFRSITTVMSARDSFVWSLELLKLSYLDENPRRNTCMQIEKNHRKVNKNEPPISHTIACEFVHYISQVLYYVHKHLNVVTWFCP